MKKIILFLIVLFSFAGCDVGQEPSIEQPISTTLSTILDVSDPRAYWPDADHLLQMYHCKETPNGECWFRLKTITDKRLTPIITYHLADAGSMEKENREDDPQFRNRNINAFYSTIHKALSDFYTHTDTTQSLSNSECFRSVVDELRFLADNKSDRRILIVASDLMEKSDILSSYLADLTNPKQLAEKLNNAYPAPQNLKGVTVIFLFDPRNRMEDQTFSLMVDVYKALLQPTGAEIKVQANL